MKINIEKRIIFIISQFSLKKKQMKNMDTLFMFSVTENVSMMLLEDRDCVYLRGSVQFHWWTSKRIPVLANVQHV